MREARDGKTNRRWGVEGVRGEKEEEEGGSLPDKEDRKPPKGLLPAGSGNHIRTQRQQVMRKGHIESEAKL